jgi:uncharacterized membrane protein YphA (DoxX/SURF4 family)
MTADPSLQLAARVLGTLVFGTAVYGKMRHRTEFFGVVANYRLLPEILVTPAAWLAMGLEALVVLSFVSGLLILWGAGLAGILLCSFAAAIAINLARGRKAIDCGCFQSALRQPLSIVLVARNLLVSAALLQLVEPGAPGMTVLQWLDGLAAGVALFVLYLTFDRLMALRTAAELTRTRVA